MIPICEYLTKEVLSEDKKKARAVRRKASRYAVINGTLYKKSFLGPRLRCVGPLQANYVLREIHEGSCSMHSDPISVVAKAIWIGYYWPTMHIDARKLIRECNDCQDHRPILRNPEAACGSTKARVAKGCSTSALQVLRRLGSIFTSVHAAVQKLKDSGKSFSSAWLTILS
ncbi:reverse transcriptase domain-containing protein [Tanacetum coccineum]